MSAPEGRRLFQKAPGVIPWSLFAILVSLGVFRPILPESIREHWRLAVLATACLAVLAVLAHLGRRGGEPYPRALAAVFFMVLAAMYLQPQRVASDGVFYYAPLRSLVVDYDLDFENEYRVLGAGEGYFQRTPTGKLPNNFSIGPALLWAPFYLLVHTVAHTGLLRPTGFGYPYFTAAATATSCFGFLGMVWFYRLARAYFDAPVSFVATLLLWLGSFHLWYMIFEPSMSHALATAAVCGYLVLCQRSQGVLGALAIGAAAGLVVLIRWQNLIFLPVGLVLLWPRLERSRWWRLLAAGSAAAVVFLPQTIYWKLLYGQFLLIPQGGTYIEWSAPQIEEVLFSSRHGLLSWSPILWVGAFGFPVVWKRAPVFAVTYLAAFGVSLYVNASVSDWWAGASFGARRFDASLPAFGLGLAAAVEVVLGWVRRRALAAAAFLLGPFLIWNLMLMGTYALGGVPLDGAVSFKQVGADALDIIYRWTGYPFSWPGALAEKARTGLPLSVYDLAGARHPSNNVEIRMGDTDALYLGAGWSLPRRAGGKTEREAAGDGASLYVALREPAPYRLIVEGGSAGEVLVRWNQKDLGAVPLAEGGSATVEIPPELVEAGVNEIHLSSPDGKPFSISRVAMVRPGNH